MQACIDETDVKNANIDIARQDAIVRAENNSIATAVWLKTRCNEVYQWIAMNVHGGMSAVRAMMRSKTKFEVIQEACLAQCEYVVRGEQMNALNGLLVRKNNVEVVTQEDRINAMISPATITVLAANNILYGGLG